METAHARRPTGDGRIRALALHVPAPDGADAPRPRSRPDALLAAAVSLPPHLKVGRKLDAAILRRAMTDAFGAGDARGAWVWKDACEAAEATMALFLLRRGRAMRRQAGSPRAMLQTRRSEESSRPPAVLHPLPLACAALQAAAVRPGDTVLEPSAGTGMLAVMAACALGAKAEGRLHFNEIAETRAGMLEDLFPEAPVTRHDAEAIADFLPGLLPSVVLMNPPFSATPGVDGRRAGTDLRHLRSAFAMLPPGGRLAAITSRHCLPGDGAWTEAFRRLDPPLVFSVAIDGHACARHGTTFDTRLAVLDRSPQGGADVRFDPSACVANTAALLDAVVTGVPPRRPLEPAPARDLFAHAAAAPRSAVRKRRIPERKPTPAPTRDREPAAELQYETAPGNAGSDAAPAGGPCEPWRPRTVRIRGAHAHPTSLVQSAVMAAVPLDDAGERLQSVRPEEPEHSKGATKRLDTPLPAAHAASRVS